MEYSTASLGSLVDSSKRFVQRLFITGENRLELLMVEVQEARKCLLHAIVLALGVAAFGLLAALTLTAAVVVWLWAYWPVAVLLTLTVLYGAAGVWLGRRLTRLLRDWQMLSATLDQLRKDRACLEENLA